MQATSNCGRFILHSDFEEALYAQKRRRVLSKIGFLDHVADNSAAGHLSEFAPHSRPTERQAEIVQTIGDLVGSRSLDKSI